MKAFLLEDSVGVECAEFWKQIIKINSLTGNRFFYL